MQRFAWILAVVGLILLVLWGVVGPVEGAWEGWPLGVGIAGLTLLLLWGWLERARIGVSMRSRAVRYGGGAVVLVLLALGLAVAANLLAVRYDKRWDITSSQRFTLSEQTLQVLDGLDQDVQIVAFFQKETPEESSFRDLVEGYRIRSPRVAVAFHDPLAEPFLSQQFEVTSQWGTVVLSSGTSRQRLESSFDEEALTNALIRVTAGREHVVCFSTGHGEADPDDDQSPDGYGAVVLKLEGQNYTVEKVHLLESGGVPDRCEVLVVPGPRVDLLPVEREAVARYVVEGGAAMLLLEPLTLPETAKDLARYGLALKEDLVLEDNPDARRIGLDATFVVVTKDRIDFHPVTEDLEGLLFQFARSVSRVEEPAEGLQVQELARTSVASWAETRMDASIPAEPTQGEDIVGSVPIAAVVEITDPAAVPVEEVAVAPAPTLPVALAESAPEALDPAADTPEEAAAAPEDAPASQHGRLVVVGDASFASNQLFVQGMNQDLFLNTVAWLVGEEDQVSIRPNEAAKGTLQVSVLQGVLVWAFALLFVPGLAVAGALGTWLRRRRL
ncbi:MAG: GldG family protein [Deltaproteobacteria bacterium]|nr:GldG family protein [Deltaproteobacteria bacterium]